MSAAIRFKGTAAIVSKMVSPPLIIRGNTHAYAAILPPPGSTIAIYRISEPDNKLTTPATIENTITVRVTDLSS